MRGIVGYRCACATCATRCACASCAPRAPCAPHRTYVRPSRPASQTAGSVRGNSVMAQRHGPRARPRTILVWTTRTGRRCGRRLPVETGVSTVRRPTPTGGRLLPFLSRVPREDPPTLGYTTNRPPLRMGRTFFSSLRTAVDLLGLSPKALDSVFPKMGIPCKVAAQYEPRLPRGASSNRAPPYMVP